LLAGLDQGIGDVRNLARNGYAYDGLGVDGQDRNDSAGAIADEINCDIALGFGRPLLYAGDGVALEDVKTRSACAWAVFTKVAARAGYITATRFVSLTLFSHMVKCRGRRLRLQLLEPRLGITPSL
jgi:hypothetical protein